MAKFDIQRLVSKGLHADNGYENTPNGLYGYAMNMRDATKNSVGVEKIKGNSLEITVPDIVAQKAKWRFKVSSFGTAFITFSLNGITAVAYISFKNGFDPFTNQSYSSTFTFYNKLNNWLSSGAASSLQNLIQLPAVTNTTIGGYFDIEINTTVANNLGIDPNTDLLIQVSSGSVSATLVQEALSADIEGETGELIPIGSIELSKRLYIFSAISLNEIGGYGEIGYYDDIQNTYTKLLGSKSLRFSTLKQIDCDGETRDGHDYIYFTDNFNPVRAIQSNSSFLNDIDYSSVADNLLINSTYANDVFWLFNDGSGAQGSITSVSDADGNMESGMYRYAVRLKEVNSNDNEGDFSNISGPVEIVSNTYSNDALESGSGHNLVGDYEVGISSNVVNFTITGVNNSIYKYADVLILYYGGSVNGIATAGYIYRNASITSSDFTFTHKNNAELEILPLDEVIAVLEDTTAHITRAKSVRIANNRLVLANITRDEQSQTLTNWAKSITIVDELTSVEALNLQWHRNKPGDSRLHDNIAEYYDTKNRAEKMGYMPFEEYRFGVQVKYKNGGWSDVFHIKDHRFDQGADTGPIDLAGKPIEFENLGGVRKIKYGATAISNGHSFIKNGFVKGMYIAIQDEYNGQITSQTQAYYNNNTNIPQGDLDTDGIQALPESTINTSWYVNGNTIDFRRRIWYGNHGGNNDLVTPYFKIKSVSDNEIVLENGVGNYFCELQTLNRPNGTPDKRRRVSSIYVPRLGADTFKHTKYAGNHPMVRDNEVSVLVPKFIVNLESVKEIISGYRIVRAPVIKEVLASGMCVVAENDRDCDAGLKYEDTDLEGRNFFYPTLTSNTWAQRSFTHGFKSNSAYRTNSTYSGLDSYISPIFNNATVNNDIKTQIHIAGDGLTRVVKESVYVASSGGENSSYQSYEVAGTLNTNRPHPAVLSQSDFNASYNGYNKDNATEYQGISDVNDYTPHRYSGRNVVYFHAPDFDVETSDGIRGYEQDWKKHGSTDMLINLGRVYFSNRTIGPNEGSFKSHTGDEIGSGLATETSPSQLRHRRILTANTGFPFVSGNSDSANNEIENSAFGIALSEGEQTTLSTTGANLSSNILVDGMKAVDAHVLYCNRIPYVPMYGDAAPVTYDAGGIESTTIYRPSMMQPGLAHNTFKHWSFYKIDDAQHTYSVNESQMNSQNPSTADTVQLYSQRQQKSIFIHSSISYGSGNNHDGIAGTQNINLGGLDSDETYAQSRRVDLTNTSSLPMMNSVLGNNVDDELKPLASCRTNKCMVMTVSNLFSPPSKDEFGTSYSTAIQDSTKPNLPKRTIGLTDGGGRKRTEADRGNKRVMGGENCFEQNIHHNWAGFADRGQNKQGVAPATTNTNLGAYGWNKMADDTGLYMGLYFRQKSNYEDGSMNHDGGKNWSEEGSKYGALQKTEYVSTGHFAKVTSGGTNIREDVVMGGDTMCQRTYTKIAGTPIADVDFAEQYVEQGGEVVLDDLDLFIRNHPYGSNEVDYNGDGTNNEFEGLASSTANFTRISPDMFSNAVVAMYSFNRINSQQRAKKLDEMNWDVSHFRPGFPFGSNLTNYLFHRHTLMGITTVKYSTGGDGWYFSEVAEQLLKTLENGGSSTQNGHHEGEERSDMSGFDKYFINSSYLYKRGQFVIGYAHENSASHRQNLATRIYYSLLKDSNTAIDNYRVFNEFNFKDLEVTYGPITHIELLNGDLFAWQPNAMSRLFMLGTTAITGTESETEILLSQDKIFSKKEAVLTNYGTSEKWSVALGRSKEGASVCVWVDENTKKIIRFDARGGVSILSDLLGVSEPLNVFCNTLGDFEMSNPVGAGGIHSVWDEQNGEFIFTFKYNIDGINPNVITYLTTDNQNATFGTDNFEDYEIGFDADNPTGEFDVGVVEADFDEIIDGGNFEAEDNNDLSTDEVIDDIINDDAGNIEEIAEVNDQTIDDGESGFNPIGGLDGADESDIINIQDVSDFNPEFDIEENEIQDEDDKPDEDVDTGGIDNDPFVDFNELSGSTGIIGRANQLINSTSTTYSSDVTRKMVQAIAREYTNSNGVVVGNKFTKQQLLKKISKYVQSETRPTSVRSKQPVLKSGSDTNRPKSIIRNIIDTYTNTKSVGDFNRDITKTTPSAASSSRSSFTSTGISNYPTSIGNALLHFNFTHQSTMYTQSGINVVADTQAIFAIKGIDEPSTLGPVIFHNSSFESGLRYWDGITTDATCTVEEQEDNSIKITATSGKVAGVKASRGSVAAGRITFSDSPQQNSTITLIDSYGKERTYKAVDSTAQDDITATTGKYDESDRTIMFERGQNATGGASGRANIVALALSKAITSVQGHAGHIHTFLSAPAIKVVQNRIGASGNTTISTTGTTSATIDNFVGGSGVYENVMPGFLNVPSLNINGLSQNQPFKQNTFYRVDASFMFDKTNNPNAILYLCEDESNPTTQFIRILPSDLNDGYNSITRYVRTSHPTPNIGFFITNGTAFLQHLQVRAILGRHLVISNSANISQAFRYRTIDGGHTLQQVNAAAGKFVYDSNLSYAPYVSLPELPVAQQEAFRNGHTIAFVVNNNSSGSTRNIFSFVKHGTATKFWTFLGETGTGRYKVNNGTGTKLVGLSKSKLGNPITDLLVGHAGGQDNVIIMTYTGTTYTVYQNGHLSSPDTFTMDYSSFKPQLMFHTDSSGSSTAPCIKEFIVLDQTASINQVTSLMTYYANKYNSNLHLDTSGTNLSAGWNSLYTFEGLSSSSYLAHTGQEITAIKKEIVAGDKLVLLSGQATADGITDSFQDSTSLADDDTEIFVIAKAYIRVVGFTGGADGSTNGKDVIRVRLQPTGTGISEIVYEKQPFISAILDTAQSGDISSSTYEIETSFKIPRANEMKIVAQLFRNNTAATSATVAIEITDTKVRKGFRYNIPDLINNRPVFAKVINGDVVKVWRRTVGTTLSGSAESLEEFATETLPYNSSSAWTQFLDLHVNEGNWARIASRADSNIPIFQDIKEVAQSFTNATLSFSEFRKKFVSYYSYVPNIYLPYKDSFMSYDKGYNTTTGMNIWNHDTEITTLGTFYNIPEKSSIFIPLNELKENQKTLYNIILEGTISNITDITASVLAVNTQGSDYKVMDAEVVCDIKQKDDYYTLTPQGRVHGKAFAIKIDSNASSTAYIKVNAVIVRCRAEGPNRNLLSRQNQLTNLLRQQQNR